MHEQAKLDILPLVDALADARIGIGHVTIQILDVRRRSGELLGRREWMRDEREQRHGAEL